jgi:hypothetical protein
MRFAISFIGYCLVILAAILNISGYRIRGVAFIGSLMVIGTIFHRLKYGDQPEEGRKGRG